METAEEDRFLVGGKDEKFLIVCSVSEKILEGRVDVSVLASKVPAGKRRKRN